MNMEPVIKSIAIRVKAHLEAFKEHRAKNGVEDIIRDELAGICITEKDSYWLKDSIGILRQSGNHMHADKLDAIIERLGEIK